MRILYINNSGGGYADHIDVADGTTIEKLFAQRLPNDKPEDFLVRVNRMPTARDQVLHEGDRISITPLKIEGARIDGVVRLAA